MRLNEQGTPDTPREERYDTETSQTTSIQGSLRPLPDMEQVRQCLSLSDETRPQLQEYCLWAERVSGMAAGWDRRAGRPPSPPRPHSRGAGSCCPS